MSLVRILLFLGILLINSKGFSQNYSVVHFNEKNGFSANTVYNIAQDKEGFIWIGTNTGLKRYDGINFKDYGIEDGLTDLQIFNISIDKQNHLFFHNFSNRPNFFYQNKFYNSNNNLPLNDIKFNNTPIANFYPNENAFILSARNTNYFYYLKLKDGEIIQKEKITLKENEIVLEIVVSDNFYFIFYRDKNNDETLYRVYKGTKFITNGTINNSVNFTTSISVNNKICFNTSDQKGVVFCYDIDSSANLNFSNKIQIEYGIKNLFSFKGNLWITLTEGGIVQADSTGIIALFLKEKTVNNVLIDNQNNIWIGTDSDGLYLIKKSKITNLSMDDNNLSKSVISLCKGKNNEVLAGLDKLAFVKINPDFKKRVYSFYPNEEPISRRVTKIIYDNKNTVYFGTDNQLFEANINSLDEKGNPSFNSIDSITSIKELLLENNDKLWVGTSSNILLKNKTTSYHSEFNDRTLSLELDEDSTLWIGTLYGLYYKKNNDSIFYQYHSSRLNSKKINDIHYYNKNLYLATDSGICCLDYRKNNLIFLTKNNDLVSNQCNRLTVYKNSIWVATALGISKINLITSDFPGNEIINITRKDGLKSNYINDILVMNDTVWAATNEGISLLSVDYKKKWTESKTNIIGAQSNLSELDIYREITLEPNENNVSITFSSMLFEIENNQKYFYQLSPNKNWIQTSENTITFSELNPGNYIFKVKSAGNISKKSIAFLKFKIKPKFHQTKWFKALLLLALILSILIFIYYKNKTNKKKYFIQQTITQLELEAIKAQINPHFIYNCLNSIKSTIIKKDTLKAEEQLSVFAKLVRQTLSNSQYNYIPINSEIEYLTNYLEMEKIRFKEKLSYSINLTKINNDKIEIPSMLIQPFVENSIKHGMPENEKTNAFITITFSSDNSTVICEIEDNGPGIEKTLANKVESKHTSLGMKITSDRAKKYNKLFDTDIDIIAFDKSTGGTCIRIKMPLKN